MIGDEHMYHSSGHSHEDKRSYRPAESDAMDIIGESTRMYRRRY